MSDKEKQPDLVKELKEKEAGEPIAKFLKMKLVDLKPGYAKVTMKVAPEHLNFNGLIFGGIVMCLADQAFAYGTNSLVTPSIATQFNIHLISAQSGRYAYGGVPRHQERPAYWRIRDDRHR